MWTPANSVGKSREENNLEHIQKGTQTRMHKIKQHIYYRPSFLQEKSPEYELYRSKHVVIFGYCIKCIKYCWADTIKPLLLFNWDSIK
jgi:hypothetical protein